MNSQELLLEWCRQGWRYRRISERPWEEREWFAQRVKYEWDLICKRDFQDVFLVVSDAIRWAKDHGIAVGPGRGSVAASVVAYLIRIHEVDPYVHPGLLFERFLDETRADPPDIDTDFEDDRRWEVREYLKGKYGAESVGQVCNFIRYLGKNALVDVARVYDVPHWAKQTVANLLPVRSGGDSRFDATLEDTAVMFPAAAKIFSDYPDLRRAITLEGNVRGWSVHAAGLVVTNGPLTDICATMEKEGVPVMSLDKYDVEAAGAIKLDFLGLTTMSIIARCLRSIGMTLEDLYALPLDDPLTMKGFQDADVIGVFQFEGRATRLVTRDVCPRNFTELADVNALSRPGPLFSGTTATYVAVRHGRKRAEKLHPIVDQITDRTKGQIIYQEQILQILRDIGGFDWFSVGQIRRIISKKVGEAAFQMSYSKFEEGAARLHGMDSKLADKIWKLMVTSGTYSFVTAHAVSYTLIGYWCMWLKQHYPVEFYAAALSKVDPNAKDGDAQFKLLKDAEAHDIHIEPPLLNVSGASWAASDGHLVAGWRQIPGIGEKTAEKIQGYKPEGGWPGWAAIQVVPGVGPKTVNHMLDFSTAPDPFGLQVTEDRLLAVRKWAKGNKSVPFPTHTGEMIAAIPVQEEYGASSSKRRFDYGKGPRVVYAGIVKERNMQDAVENRRSRTGEEAEDILRTMRRPDLLEYCSLRCFDDSDEEVYLRINRFKFPALRRIIESIAVGHDVVIAIGKRIPGFGTPVMVDRLFVVDPD